MHGEMYANAAGSPHSGAAPLTFKLLNQSDTNRSFQFQKGRQLFIGVHNAPLSVAMRVRNPNCSSVGINC